MSTFAEAPERFNSPLETIGREVIPAEIDGGVGKLWNRFDYITQIPRKSGQEQDLIEHVTSLAESKGFQTEVDKNGNVLILVPATEGFQNAPGIILQGHLDMVCVGKPDPATNGVTPKMSEDGKWIEADGTSLGADNGIGVSAALALADEKNHGPLALMLTVKEEVGLKGAMAMSFETPLDDYKFLFNFDSGKEGKATISCAGGGDTIISLPIDTEHIEKQQLLTISLEGLMSGHSGLKIGEKRINGIKAMLTVLNKLTDGLGEYNLVSIEAGQTRNVIPSEAQITIAVDVNDISKIPTLITMAKEEILSSSLHDEEQSLTISHQNPEKSITEVLTAESSKKIIKLLSMLPDGVKAWSQSVEGLVETSTNLATVTTESNILKILLMTRSSVDEDISKVRSSIQQIAEGFGAKVQQPDPYPGWPANPDSLIIEIAKNEWKKLTDQEMEAIAKHSGLECGAIIGKYPHLEAVAMGPKIEGEHSINERVNIASVRRFYQLAKNIIQTVSNL